MLAQPLIVEAIEENFVPVAIYNNAGGNDKKIRKQFKEPAWNYQVMRFLNPQLSDIIPRRDKVWDVHSTAKQLVSALEAFDQDVPNYLSNVLIPESDPNNRFAVFAMHCFWTGEARLGSLDGVVNTEAGFYDGKEVVVVKFNDKQIDLIDVVRAAEKFDCAHAVYLATKEEKEQITGSTRLKNVSVFDFEGDYRRAPQRDQKKQIAKLQAIQGLHLTPMQWTKLNARVVSKDALDKWLSPRQIAKLAK